jgi:hypothetical protein
VDEDKKTVFDRKKAQGVAIGGTCLTLLAMVHGGLEHGHDSLSRDLNLEANNLTLFLIFALPEQVPKYFRISLLPSAVDYLLISLFQELVSGESRDAATVAKTRQKKQAVWRRWIEYSESTGIHVFMFLLLVLAPCFASFCTFRQ